MLWQLLARPFELCAFTQFLTIALSKLLCLIVRMLTFCKALQVQVGMGGSIILNATQERINTACHWLYAGIECDEHFSNDHFLVYFSCIRMPSISTTTTTCWHWGPPVDCSVALHSGPSTVQAPQCSSIISWDPAISRLGQVAYTCDISIGMQTIESIDVLQMTTIFS